MAERGKRQRKFQEERQLVQRLKAVTPNVQPIWDMSSESVEYNDINAGILAGGIFLYSATLQAVWSGLFEPSIYDVDTLWSGHCDRKIALVIHFWEKGIPLSPPFLVKHGRKPLGLIADGKHRLTVARYMAAREMPFMVPKSEAAWVRSAIPSAEVEIAI